MAGESPDKSDKKQSSGETAGSERDPRLTVFREKPDPAEPEGAEKSGEPGGSGKPEKSAKSSKSEGAAEEAVSDGGGDAEAEAAVDAGADGAAEKEPEAPQEAAADGEGAGSDSGGGDDRLRAAVAAWVERTDEAEGAEGADAAAEADAEAEAEAEPDVESDAKAAVKAAEKPGVEAEAEAEVVEPADKIDDDKIDDAGDEDGQGDGAAGAGDEPEAEPEREPASESESESERESKPASEAKAESKPALASRPVDQPTAVFKTAGPKGDGKGDGKGGDDAKADEPPVDNATRAFAIANLKGKLPAEPPVDQPTTAFKITPPGEGKGKGKAKDKDDAGEKADAGKSGDKAAKSDPKNNDVKNSDPQNDAGKGADAGKGGKAAPERDAERTSQFVALKSADDGAAAKSLGKTASKTPLPAPTPVPRPDKAPRTPLPAESGKPAAPAKPDTPSARTGATAAAGTTAPDRPQAQPRPEPDALPESERTRQEPLPPLDLLAKLTNTPPPPETPLRTVVRRFKIWTPLAVLLAIIFVIVQAVRPLPAPELAVGSSTAFTFEGGKLSVPWPDQGQSAAEVVGVGSLGTSGKAKPVPTASVAKVMTAYVILRDHPLKKGEKGDTITIDAQAEADSKKKDESRVPLTKGQKFTQYQMLQMLMIPSGNNAARQLARWDTGGSEPAFVKKMNAAAKKLGMTNTKYTGASGFEPTTVSTAVDQLKLAEEVMKNDAFREIVTTENVQIQGLPQKIYNNNSLLTNMPGVVRGIKTGSSTPAGGAFMWAAYRTVGGKDQLLLGVTMDQHTSSTDPNAHLALALENTSKVITAAKDALASATVVKKGQVVGYVDDGLGGQTPVVATKNLSAVGWPGMKAAFSISDGGKAVPHEAKAGTKVGVLTVGEGESAQKVPVALQKDLAEPTFGAKLTRIG
ncbi:D-alanyl-D-alanine carboxypeptidase [Streptomyces piniterrae]|uniref:D-alanyl-D-alanine carboxypeptidase n=1 Tax=Streptomyces piniterrae TaxID=2571125 RepID=A0A4U0NPY4_9ACTN|nr:serine hydrolase [Streptomyces piniterrae]TJZ52214.1 D-alanyl-D-alanine carboxypeptidase [Streptomyces piniterrae]